MDTLEVNKLMKDFVLSKQSRVILFGHINFNVGDNQGRRLRGNRGIVPLKYLGGGDRDAFILLNV